MGRKRDTATGYAESARLWITQPFLGCLYQIPSIRANEILWKRRKKYCKTQREMGVMIKNKKNFKKTQEFPNQHKQNLCIHTETEAACIGLHQVLCVYVMDSSFLFLCDTYVCDLVGLIPVPSLGLSFFCWFVLHNKNGIVSFRFFHIIFCCGIFLREEE